MPDATECWLVEYVDLDKRTVFDRFATVDEAIPFLHKILGTGQRPRLYRETPITLTIDVDGEAPVKSPRRRRKKEAKEGSPEKGRSPADDGGASAGGPVLQTGPDGCQSAEENRATKSGDASDGEKDGAPKPEPAPIPLWDCEARLDSAPACPGPIHYDTFTRGRFCSLHMPAIPIDGRMELHRRHGSRNRPVRVAHAG